MTLNKKLVSLAFVAATAAVASANTSNMYVKAGGGYVFKGEQKYNSIQTFAETTAVTGTRDHKAKKTKGAVGYFGFGYKLNDMLSAEVEGIYFQTKSKKVTLTAPDTLKVDATDSAKTTETDVRFKSKNLGLFLNGVAHVKNASMFTPYALVGVGIVWKDVQHKVNTLTHKGFTGDAQTVNTPYTAKMKKKAELAGQVGLGVKAAFSKNVAFDMAVRFISTGKTKKSKNTYDMGRVDLVTGSGTDAGTEVAAATAKDFKAKRSSNMLVTAGLVFSF